MFAKSHLKTLPVAGLAWCPLAAWPAGAMPAEALQYCQSSLCKILPDLCDPKI